MMSDNYYDCDIYPLCQCLFQLHWLYLSTSKIKSNGSYHYNDKGIRIN